MDQQAESKSDRFHRIGNKRVPKLLKEIELIENLSNTGSYSYTEAEVAAMFGAIDKALDSVRASFKKGLNGHKRGPSFQF